MASRLIYGDEERLLSWATRRIGLVRFRADAKTIGLEKNGELAAVVVFDTFSSTDCSMHIASDGSRRWMNRELLVAAFAYPFVQCGLRRVTGLVAANNAEALAFDEHLGFEREGLFREACPDGTDLVALGMLRRNCRFIPRQAREGQGQ